ncbi:inositol monophosphatase family protein [Nocardioides jensenii]|uniref:inositol monophosphatase family protein n=1 Tax=Nocardioides jensenii TaxID=1843 RepID=UPI00082B65C0|nr:inositol monophosphatase family protein [Nocardioides jensenii]
MGLSDVEVAVAAARAGADVVARSYGGRHTRFAKSATDFATQTDIDAEQAIVQVLREQRPDDARTGEESGSSGGEHAVRRWLVDPLCGTLNFAATTPLVAVNVALMSGDTALAAASVDPIAREIFFTDGIRAFIRRDGDDQALGPTSESGLVDINCDGPLDRAFVGGQLVGDPELRKAFGPRVISSTLAVAWVAAGRRAAYVSDGQFRNNVHFAAGLALCRASDCVISDLDGNPLHTDRGLIVSADQETHDRMLELVEPHLRAARSGVRTG